MSFSKPGTLLTTALSPHRPEDPTDKAKPPTGTAAPSTGAHARARCIRPAQLPAPDSARPADGAGYDAYVKSPVRPLHAPTILPISSKA